MSSYVARVEEGRKDVGAERGGTCVLPGQPQLGVRGERSPASVEAACREKVLNISSITFLWVACSFLPA